MNDSENTTAAISPVLSTDGLERMRLKGRLVGLAAQMATRQGMPAPEDWPGWGPRVPQKLWRAASDECDKADRQCGDWAHELRKIADAL